MSGGAAQQGRPERTICTVGGRGRRSGCFTAGETKRRNVSELQMKDAVDGAVASRWPRLREAFAALRG